MNEKDASLAWSSRKGDFVNRQNGLFKIRYLGKRVTPSSNRASSGEVFLERFPQKESRRSGASLGVREFSSIFSMLSCSSCTESDPLLPDAGHGTKAQGLRERGQSMHGGHSFVW